jgi:hypothetical protein
MGMRVYKPLTTVHLRKIILVLSLFAFTSPIDVDLLLFKSIQKVPAQLKVPDGHGKHVPAAFIVNSKTYIYHDICILMGRKKNPLLAEKKLS